MLVDDIRIDRVYGVREAAELLRVDPHTVRIWCRAGQIPGARRKRTRHGNAAEWGIPGADLRKIRDDGVSPPPAKRGRKSSTRVDGDEG